VPRWGSENQPIATCNLVCRSIRNVHRLLHASFALNVLGHSLRVARDGAVEETDSSEHSHSPLLPRCERERDDRPCTSSGHLQESLKRSESLVLHLFGGLQHTMDTATAGFWLTGLSGDAQEGETARGVCGISRGELSSQ